MLRKQCPTCRMLISNANFEKHVRVCPTLEKKIEIKSLYDSGLSTNEIVELGHNSTLVGKCIKGQRRTSKEGTKLAREKHPELFMRKQESNDKLSKTRKEKIKSGEIKKWYHHHQDGQSYAEKYFQEVIENEGYIKNVDFKPEFRFKRFKADFYFPKLGIVVEIDGVQHTRDERQKEIDQRKDKYIRSQNVDVIRIIWRIACKNKKEIFDDVKSILVNRKITGEEFLKKQVGMLEPNKKYVKKQEHEKNIENKKKNEKEKN